ncbi:hypothetical protein [Arthrobacter sp. S2(2024)]|uniref:hypothetical protein n=1 Tax=Arthrobacter sp. S2(2024) TaxID=3111911 RepID=UPI002FC99B0C
MGDLWCDREVAEERRDVVLADPGHAAVGPFHGLQRGRQRDQIVGDGSRGRVGEQVIYDIAEDACPAAAAAVEFIFGPAALAVDVESDA